MIRDPHVLSRFLYEHPQAWPVRMALIEELIRDGDVKRAKALVRESPDDSRMPPEYSHRIHALMTDGAAALDTLPPLLGFEDRTPAPSGSSEPVSAPPASPSPESGAGGKRPTGKDKPGDSRQKQAGGKGDGPEEVLPDEKIGRAEPLHQHQEPVFEFRQRKAKLSEEGELLVIHPTPGGGAGALVEDKTIHRKKGGEVPPPNIDRQLAAIRWEEYAGKLHLTGGRLPETVGRKSAVGDRFSATAAAVVVHLILAVFITLAVIHVPMPNPPKLIVSIPDNDEGDDLIVHRLTKPTDKTPSAASSQAVNVETSISISDFSLPEVEDTRTLDVTAMVDGAAEIGAGMSLAVDTHQQSDVNFFGISSGGKKIVFIIDAHPKMLVDEKGGMFAYDKVKHEIVAMLSALNRGTKFNIMIYQGKRVVAFRDELVKALPSNKRLAAEWMDPLNRDYDNLGLTRDFGGPVEVADLEGLPIRAVDVGYYTKCIQKAMEWKAAAIFCITSGYERMGRSPTPEMRKKMMENPREPGEPGEVDPADRARYERERAAYQEAVRRTREWLDKENEARREKGLPPKVVLNFGELVREVTGATPPRGPRRTGGRPAGPPAVPPLPPVTPEDIEDQLKRLVKVHYRDRDLEVPSVHMVLFLGEEEPIPDQEKEHFGRITRRNYGKLKLLRGLAALEDLTGK